MSLSDMSSLKGIAEAALDAHYSQSNGTDTLFTYATRLITNEKCPYQGSVFFSDKLANKRCFLIVRCPYLRCHHSKDTAKNAPRQLRIFINCGTATAPEVASTYMMHATHKSERNEMREINLNRRKKQAVLPTSSTPASPKVTASSIAETPKKRRCTDAATPAAPTKPHMPLSSSYPL